MRELWGFLMCLLLESGMCSHSTMLECGRTASAGRKVIKDMLLCWEETKQEQGTER